MLRLRFLTIIKFSMTALVWLSLMNVSEQLQAKPFSETVSQSDSPDFSGDGRPKRTAGGASRGECQVEQPSDHLTALIPNTSVALTVSSAPTFWVYVPYNLTAEHSAELVLKDKQGNFVYQNKFSGEDVAAGIINLSLPSTVSLTTDRDYDWYFLVYCDRANPNKFVYVNGSVKRVQNLVRKSQLKEINKEEELSLYTKENIWYDALTIVAENLQTDPQNTKAQQDWTNLLTSVDLEYLKDRAFQSCCLLDSESLSSEKLSNNN